MAHALYKFMCQYCQKYFARKEILKTHIQSIHEGKTFQCQHCEYKVTRKYTLKKHIFTVHTQWSCQTSVRD